MQLPLKTRPLLLGTLHLSPSPHQPQDWLEALDHQAETTLVTHGTSSSWDVALT